MKLYKLPISLDTTSERINVGVVETNKQLTRHDLFPNVIQAINTFARDDFEMFGYTMIDGCNNVVVV